MLNFLDSFFIPGDDLLPHLKEASLPLSVLLLLGLSFSLILLYRWFKEEQKRSLRALKTLETSSQEWFYFCSRLKKGIGSQGLSAYLEWEPPLERLEDFIKAVQHAFSFDLQEILSSSQDTKESFKKDLVHPETGKSCLLSLAWAKVSPTQTDVVFWVQDTFEFRQEMAVQHQKLESVIEENARLKEILDILPLPVWFRNSQGWLTYCNHFYAEALDRSLDYVTQENTLLWIDGRWEGDLAGRKNLQNLTEPLKRHILVHGERRYFEFREHSLNNLEGVMGYGFDLTDLEKALTELQQHTMAYREVLEHLSAGVTIYGADKRLKFFNHAYARLFEMDEHWLNTSPTLGEVLDDVRERRILPEQADYQLFRKQQLQMVSSLISPFQQLDQLPDGRTLRKITSPHPLGGVFFIFEDVTSSLSLERQYNTQLAVHRASLDNLYEGVAVFGSDNQLKLVNPAFARIWKMDLAHIKPGQHLSEIVDKIKDIFVYDPEEEWEECRKRLVAQVTDRIPKKSVLNCQDGRVIDFTYVPLPDGSHLLTSMDVTDSHRIEKILDIRSLAS